MHDFSMLLDSNVYSLVFISMSTVGRTLIICVS